MQIESLEIIDHIRQLLDQVMGIEEEAADEGRQDEKPTAKEEKPEAPATQTANDEKEAAGGDPEPDKQNDQKYAEWVVRQKAKKK